MIELIKTKNHRQQLIPMADTLTYILIEYLKYRKGNEGDYLFCNSDSQKLTESAIQGTISRFNRSRGVMKTSLHQFRHTFAKSWIMNGGDMFKLQKILGHSSLDMVKEYVNMYDEDLKRNFNTFNPLENLYSNKQSIKMNKQHRV